MFGNNSDDDSTDDENNIRSFVYNAFGIGDEPEPDTDDEGEDEPEDTGTQPRVSLRTTEPRHVQRWSLGDHTAASDIDADEIRAAVDDLEGVDDDLAAVLGEAAGMVEGRKVSGFECPVCGLNHGHSDQKHDSRDLLNVDESFADEMPFCPWCHCGVNWLAEIVDFIPYTEVPMFSDEDEFTPFLDETDVEAFEATIQHLEEARSDPDSQPSIEAALEDAGVEPTDEMVASVDTFYTRYTDIKTAAENAPIADETRQRINSMIDDIETQIEDATADDTDDEGVLAIVDWVDTFRGTGSIISDDDESAAIYESRTSIRNVAWRDLYDGAEIIVHGEMQIRGERVATDIELTDQ